MAESIRRTIAKNGAAPSYEAEKIKPEKPAARRFSDILSRLIVTTKVDLNWLLNDEDETPENAWPVLLESRKAVAGKGDLEKRIAELEREREKDDALIKLLTAKVEELEEVGRIGKQLDADGDS